MQLIFFEIHLLCRCCVLSKNSDEGDRKFVISNHDIEVAHFVTAAELTLLISRRLQSNACSIQSVSQTEEKHAGHSLLGVEQWILYMNQRA